MLGPTKNSSPLKIISRTYSAINRILVFLQSECVRGQAAPKRIIVEWLISGQLKGNAWPIEAYDARVSDTVYRVRLYIIYERLLISLIIQFVSHIARLYSIVRLSVPEFWGVTFRSNR